MTESAKKLRDFYEVKPNAPFYLEEFGYYSIEKWQKEEGMPAGADLNKLFGFDEPAYYGFWGLGWCEAGFYPVFEDKVIEDRGEHEVVQDFAGRHVLVFKGRRSGFMPDYIGHPVKDMKTWVEKCKWRMDTGTPERYKDFDKEIEDAKNAAVKGFIIRQHLAGGYMYLRSLIGPEELFYMVYDNPELITDCMETWFKLADNIIAKRQQHVSFDELFIGEDITYNHGALISPDMIKKYLFPYYQQLLENMKKRQIDKSRKLHFHVDTDGFSPSVIPLYKEIGMTRMSPFEVASYCDVVEIGRQYPDLIMSGGFDKRILAAGKDAIDKEVARIFPVMRKRGGYYPTCDHGVPEEVKYQDYVHFRKRCLEFAK